MKLQRIGGLAAVVYALLLVFFLVVVAVLFPRLGLVGPGDWGDFDPVKNITARTDSPSTFFSLDLGFLLLGIASILFVLALRERMEADTPNIMQIALIGASIACALYIAHGLIEIVGFPSIITAKDASALRAGMAVTLGLGIAGSHALGWAFLLSGCAALKTAALPKMLACLLILNGIISIIVFAVPPVMLVGTIAAIVSSLWLGAVLLRSRTS